MHKQREIALLVILILVALLIRGYDLERQSLWNDEMFTMDVASRPIDEIHDYLAAHYHHPPLYFYLANLSTIIFGMSAWAIRLPSVIFGALTIGLVYSFARKLFNTLSSTIAATFCLFSPFHIAYSQEGRPYALAAFLCTASFYTFYLILKKRNKYALFLYPLSTIALLFTHHWGVFAISIQIIYAIIFEHVRFRKNNTIFIIWIIIGFFYFLEFYALRSQFIHAASVSWFWAKSPCLKEIYNLLTAFSGTYFNMATSIFCLPVQFQVVGAIILIGLLISGIILIIKIKNPTNLHFLSFSFYGFIIIPFIISFFKPEIFLWYRYPLIGFPLLCIAVGGIIFFLQNRTESIFYFTGVSAAGILILLAIYGMLYYMSWQKSNVRDVVLFTEKIVNDHNVQMVIRPRTFSPLFNYYYKSPTTQYDETYLNEPLGEIVDTASSFVYISIDVTNEIRDYMDGHFDKIIERRFPGEANMGMIVGLYKQKPDLEEMEE